MQMAPNLQDPASRRASCDQCSKYPVVFDAYKGLAELDKGQKKLKCDGEYPECGRCSGMGETCKYSARLPMGRPKKRKLQQEGEEDRDSGGSTTVTSGTSPSTLTRSMSSDAGSEQMLAFDPCLQPPSEKAPDLASWGCDTNVDPKLLAIEPESGQQTCACLASLYLSLEEVRKLDGLPFTARLSLLRHLTSTAAGIIQCQVCPTKFLWAMQNAQLLNTLIISIAEGYKKIVKSVEDETQRAREANESKLLFISEGGDSNRHDEANSSSGSGSGNTSHDPSGFPLTLDPLDWQGIAKKAIKAEIFGSPHSMSTSFTTMLQLMEERQQGWHSGALPVTAGIGCRMPHQMKDKDPHCVSLVKHTRGMVSHLLLDV
ncbi:hypothetical protein ACJZ2D_012663 [Fusarium nematophilum]